MDETLYDLLLERGLTEEQIDQLAALGALGGEFDILGRQQTQAQGLMGTGGAQPRTYGDIYRHAHPLEHLGTLGNRVLGAYQMSKLDERQRELGKQQTAGRQMLLRAILGGAGAGGMQNQMPAQAPMQGISRTRMPDLRPESLRRYGR